jgi:hypothetical protein
MAETWMRRLAAGAACSAALMMVVELRSRGDRPSPVTLRGLDRSEPGCVFYLLRSLPLSPPSPPLAHNSACARFVEFPRNEARWWGETQDGFGYDRRGADRLGREQEFDHFTTPVGGDIDHYDFPRHDRGPGHRLGFAPADPKKGWGPVYYGDTKVYGASVGKDYAKQPFPVYTDYTTEGAAHAAGRDQEGYWRETMEMPEGYMEGFAKDFFAYFPAEDAAGQEVPNPIEAGYWPYTTPDGFLAAGDPGAAGEAWRSFAEEDKKSDDGVTTAQEGDDMDDVDKYLDAESSVYTNDMRYYLEDDWP